MIDPTWAADDAYRMLREAVEACIDGSMKPAHLRAWMTAEFYTPPETSSHHPVKLLYGTALINLAIYLQCALDREELATSLQLAIDQADARQPRLPRLLVTPCGNELMKQAGSIEALTRISGNNRRRQLAAEGFEEI